VTQNHAHNPSPGPNNLQNFPVLTFVLPLPNGETLVTGTLHSAPNTTYTLDFYASATADPSGYGEGQRYLGSVVVKTDGSGNFLFVGELPAVTTRGEVVTATATNQSTGDTSEFSAALIVRVQLTGNSSLSVLLDLADLLNAQLKSLIAMGEMELQSLQVASDPQSEFIATLANILTTISDVGDSLVQNLK
jgi:hypothetical protein